MEGPNTTEQVFRELSRMAARIHNLANEITSVALRVDLLERALARNEKTKQDMTTVRLETLHEYY